MATGLSLRLVMLLNYQNVILEGYALNVFLALDRHGPDSSDVGNIIADVRDAAAMLQHVNFVRVRHEGYDVAHALARHARHLVCSTVCIDNAASVISLCLMSDNA